MKINKYVVALVISAFLGILACSPDDDNVELVPERDRTEQQMVDNDSLIGYFQTHYYNSSLFEVPGNYSLEDIVINELPQDENGNYLDLPDPDNNTLLIDDVEEHTTVYQETDYKYYILRLNQGGGEASPYFVDDVRINYKGNLMDDDVFDSTVNPTTFDLINLIRGWQLVLPQFNESTGFTSNPDGTVQFENYGFGVMFLPSGLGYYSSPPIGVPSYSNMIFKFELYQTEINDHEADNVPSYIEDLDGDLDIFNDDTDGDDIPNFLDLDDDGDGVFTAFEDIDGDGDPTNDIGANGIPKYLDPEETESTLEED